MFGRKENELLFLPSPSLGDIVCNINALLPNMNYTTLRCQSRLVAVVYSGLIIFLSWGPWEKAQWVRRGVANSLEHFNLFAIFALMQIELSSTTVREHCDCPHWPHIIKW